MDTDTVATGISNMPLAELVAILRRSDEKPNPTARDKKAGALLVEKCLGPIAERTRSVGLESEFIGGHSSAKPHFISELRLAGPTRPEWIPQLRVALTQIKRNEEKELTCSLGATISQRSEVGGESIPPHIRWGVWTDSPHAKARIGGPFRIIAEKMEWEDPYVISRPSNNMARGWLSFLGKEVTVEDLEKYSSFDELADQIAQDLVGLNNVMRA